MARPADLRRRSGRVPWPRYHWRQWHSLLWPETLRGRAVVSMILHAGAVFLLFNVWWLGAPRLKPAGTTQGQRVMVTYNPGKPAPPPPSRHTMVTRRYPHATPAPILQQDAVERPQVQGNDALGSGTVSLLYVQAFPPEKPDLSGAGPSDDVVVDLEIDDTGHVTQVHARHGMGTKIDSMIVATVEHWVFHPALRNGQAIRSQRELRFHFDRRNDPNCGWECFALQE